MVDHTKFDIVSLVTFAELKDIDKLITDTPPLQLLQRLFDTENTTATGAFPDVVHCDAADNAAFSYTAQATDPDAGDVLTFSLVGAPSGMTINAGSGVISLPR